MFQNWVTNWFSMILDLRERQCSMTFNTDILTKKLRKAIGQKEALVNEVESMYLSNVFSWHV